MNGAEHLSTLTVNEQDIELDGSDTSSDEKTIIQAPYDVSKIRIEPKNLSLDLILERLKHGEINLKPGFQRQASIWTPRAQSRLIESLLLRIPIPAFYFDATDEGNWLVVDGLQRLTALDNLIVKQKTPLDDLEFLGVEYNNLYFNDLPRALQRTIKETTLVTYQLLKGTPEEVKFNVFQRINTGGLPLNPQEIRQSLNSEKVLNLLEELVASGEFKKATTNSISTKRMDDKECVTRFIVFLLRSPENYDKNDYDGFLNDGIKEVNNLSDNTLNEIKEKFLTVMHYAFEIFGDDAFRKRYHESSSRYPINKALFESWSVSLALLDAKELQILVTKKEYLKQKFMMLMNTEKFDAAVTQGTGSSAKVKLRHKEIKRIIQEVLNA